MSDTDDSKPSYRRLGPFRVPLGKGSGSTPEPADEGSSGSRTRSLFKSQAPLGQTLEEDSTAVPAPRMGGERPLASRISGVAPTIAMPHSRLETTNKGLEEVTKDLPAPDEAPSRSSRTVDRATMPRFRPIAPRTFEEAGIAPGAVESLLVKFLATTPGTSGRRLSHEVGISGRLVQELLLGMKNRKVVVHRGSAAVGDFIYELSESGRDLAGDLNRTSRYSGRAPVSLHAYIQSVRLQSVSLERPRQADLERAFKGLILDPKMLGRLGPAINAGKGCFMFGPPGNGKTSMAERITAAYRSLIFIPYAVDFGGQLVRVYDPAVHEAVDADVVRQVKGTDKLDYRWVLCKRPTIVVGGELTMDALELTYDSWSGTSEAPIQMKSNGGTLVIDDLGRQAMPPATLLNRWIVPMEKRVDYLRVPGGRKVEVPFDPMLVFSTNLEPRSLVDDAFLRRIPYKIDVHDPDEATFRTLMVAQARVLGLELDESLVDALLARHYRGSDRPMRMCHPRDLLLLVKSVCEYREQPLTVSSELLDEAVELYFSVI